MADRALLDLTLITPLGVARASKTLTFYEENGSTPLAQSLYAAESGGSPLVPPYTTNSVGTFRAYVMTAQDAVCVASDDPSTPFPVQFNADQADEVLRGQSDVPLASLIVGPDQTTDVPLIVKGQVAQTANLAEWRNSSGTVLHSMGVDTARLNGTVTITGTVTAAKIQAALDDDLGVIIPEGEHTISTTITLPVGASIQGMGHAATKLTWGGSTSSNMFSYAAGSFTPSFVTIKDLTLQTLVTDITGIRIVHGGHETISDVHFKGIKTHIYMFGGGFCHIRGLWASTLGVRPSGGTQLEQVTNANIEGFTTYEGDPAVDADADATAKLRLTKVAVCTVSGINIYSSPASPFTTGILVDDNSQGVVLTNGAIVGGTNGIVLSEANGDVPYVTTILGVNVDQSSGNAIAINYGHQTRISNCAITDSGGGILIGTYNGGSGNYCVRTDISDCKIEAIQTNAIVLNGGASQVSIHGNRFLNIGSSGAGACVVVSSHASLTSDDILIANNDMSVLCTHGTISDAAKAGSTDRRYYDNLGTAASISNATGTIVRHGASVLVDGVEWGIDHLEVSYRQAANASLIDECFFVANRAYEVVAIREVHATAGNDAGSVNLQVTKDTSTNAPGAGTDLLTNNTNAGFNLKGTANTVQTGTLTATTSNLQLAAGDRLSVDYAGTLTTLAGVVVTVTLKRI